MDVFSPPDGTDICGLNAAQVLSAYRKGTLSPIEVTEAALERAEAVNGELNAFTFIDRDRARNEARRSEARWGSGAPLSDIDGIPTTIKDIVWVEGWSVRCGSRTTTASPCERDAPSVERLRRSGAIFIGQTTTPEFGWKAVTDSPLFGVTRNAWDPSMTAGGSSGGAAVAAAVGAGSLHLGSDGGGSIRIPASFNGIVGHKPSFGRVPAHPPSAFGTVAHIGPMARSVGDAEAMLEAMSGRDLRDWAQGAGILPRLGKRQADFTGMRIGYWSTPPVGHVDREVELSVAAAVRRMEEWGAIVEPVELPSIDLLELFHIHWFSGAANRLVSAGEVASEVYDAGFLLAAAKGREYSAATLVAAQVLRAEFGTFMDELLESYNVLVSPAAAIPPFAVGRDVPEGSGLSHWTEWASFSFPINLSQQPACVVPCGMTASGAPIGLQFVGARGNDSGVLATARAYELVSPEHFRMVDLTKRSRKRMDGVGATRSE
ncbi:MULTISPECIES: amidase [Bradyrhizobium]|uniref:amidase n=1 Tax=Bradyrhizobium TaxID=374 RepID=UPI00042062AD|nr:MULTISPECIES: amidase [Bradyrhizobium]MBR0882587.1 amidase [Bradyrhizobium liaoningense]MBR1002555.1 amidase [Bradyrhizobium liaoningense]MBR1068842.1 amidase [Bradyrhizobium liaoningense]WLB94323.1 amidase [Bradyrhizobium japonicum USDA 123]